jgi:hypothetical protein
MIKNYLLIRCLLLVFCAFSMVPLYGQQLAFPGAEGAGRFTTGGRGGEVYEVTNLNNSGEGSLRAGIAMSGPRTIVFRVSGTIPLESDIVIRNGDLTIAGQTAPGDGIAIKGASVKISADNVIVRYIRFRPGDISGRELDALEAQRQQNIIIDHCSMSWATDEVGSFYDNRNFTLQWSVLSESLYESVHGKGRHGYGGIWGGEGVSFHHNLLTHHSSRNPRFNGARYNTTPETEIVDFRNNVIYNWGGNSAYGGEGGNHNLVANYYKAGPATRENELSYRIVDAATHATDELGRWYVSDNYVHGYPEVTADNWNGGVQRISEEQMEIVRVHEPFPFAPVETQPAEEAFESVVSHAGASYPRRDPVDARIMEEVANGAATYGGVYGEQRGIIDTQETVGGWPEFISAPAAPDSDHDGMPDAWEEANGLNPEDPEDGKQLAENGYSHLENYLNAILETTPEDFLRHPSHVSATNISPRSLQLNWVDNADRETEILLERSADGENWEQIASLEVNTTSYTDEGLESGQEYFYRLKVLSDAEESVYSVPFAVQTQEEPTAPDQDALLAYWTFNASEGTAVEDMSTYEHHAEIKGIADPDWVSGRVHNALDLQGADASAHIKVPHAEHLALDKQSFTISFWMNARELDRRVYVFHKGTFMKTNNGATGQWYGLEIKDGLVRFAVDDDATKSEVVAGDSDFVSGEWVHVALVRDLESRSLRIYRNSELIAEADDNTRGGIGHTDPLVIANSSNLNVPYTGKLDEFRIYDYGLRQAEIAGIYAGIPMRVYDPSPEQGAMEVNPDELTLQWKGDAVTYDVYIGTSADEMELLAEGLTAPLYSMEGLEPGAEYVWRVDAVGERESQSGETWAFTTGTFTGVEDSTPVHLFNCYPNPFSRQLRVAFELPKPEEVVLALYDMQNRLIVTAIDARMEAGAHQVVLSKELQALPEGMYYCVLQGSSQKLVRRVMLLKE